LGGKFGVRFVGESAGDTLNTLFIPTYTLLDTGLRFQWCAAHVGINATNLTDRRYVATCTGEALLRLWFREKRYSLGTVPLLTMQCVRDLLYRPRRLWLRRAFFQIHLWTGVPLTLYLVVIGVSGSLLVFEEEFTAIASSPSTTFDASHTAGIPAVLQASEEALAGSKAFFILTPTAQHPVYRVCMKDPAMHEKILTADPTTGAILPRRSKLWIEWVPDLHVNLLLGDEGVIVNGVGAAAPLVLAVTGSALWWPGLRLWVRALKVSFRSNWRRSNFDIHNVIGVGTLAFVGWWGLSGVYFAWPVQVEGAINFISPIRGMRPPVMPH
jgi:hypothetical protein